MHYSEEDFKSYMKYLMDDQNCYFDKKYVSRLQ